MFYSIVLIRRISTTIAGRYVKDLSLEKSWPQMVLGGKLIVSLHPCVDSESGRGSDPLSPPPLKNHKAIGFLIKTCPDPLKNYKSTKPAFNIGPSSVRLLANTDKQIMAYIFLYYQLAIYSS